MPQKNDGLINWVEPNNLGFLPKDIEKDTLSVLLRLLIMKVKEDHAKHQYRKELKHYAPDIVEIVKFAIQNQYKPLEVNFSNYSSAYSRVFDVLEDNKKISVDNNEIIINDIPGIVEDLSVLDEEIDYSKL